MSNQRCQTRNSKFSSAATVQAYPGPMTKPKYNNRTIDNPRSSSFATTEASCSFCKSHDHNIRKCSTFIQCPVNERFDAVKKLSLCINCLNKEHSVKHCKFSKYRSCQGAHHTLLHFSNSLSVSGAQSSTPSKLSLSGSNYLANSSIAQSSSSPLAADCSQSSSSAVSSSLFSLNYHTNSSIFSSNSSLMAELQPNNSSTEVSSLSSSYHSFDNHIFLATAIDKIKDQSGNYQFARALLDSGSQRNFITQRLTHTLNLTKVKVSAIVGGISDVQAKVKYSKVTTIASQFNDYCSTVSFLVLPNITEFQPSRKVDIRALNIPANIDLADPYFNSPQPVDLLIGAELFFSLLESNRIHLKPNGPILQKPKMGWIVSGSFQQMKTSITSLFSTKIDIVEENPEDNLNQLVHKFCEIETLSDTSPPLSKEHIECEHSFQTSTKRLPNGRFMVKLPFREGPAVLGSSKEIALNRFKGLERRLRALSQLKQSYTDFLTEYEKSGHMEPADWPEANSAHYFMPHHCVVRPDKSTTKTRVVFDASCKTSNQKSLNDILMVGPTVQSDLLSIILRFRLYRYGLTADVAAMFRQIKVYPEDESMQLIVWRTHEDDNLQVYKLKSVTYGTAPAPFLATRCLVQLANDNSSLHPGTSSVILRDIYVDDLITGGNTLDEIINIKSNVQKVLLQGQFQLRKWYSNHEDFLNQGPSDEQEKTLRLKNTEIIKTLGVIWDPKADVFNFNFDVSQKVES